MRIDKYVWAMRHYKTRALASKACSGEQVKLYDEFCKPGKAVKVGDLISIKMIPIWRSFEILEIPKSRVGAKLVPLHILETTSKEDLEQLESSQLMNRQNKSLGIKGRPTKKDRRDMDKLRP